MKCVILVDNSNVFIEGQKCSGVRKGLGTDPISSRLLHDLSWRIDFGRLLTWLAENREIETAFLVGSRPPPNDDVWKLAESGGFRVITHDRNSQNKEKAVDTEIVAQGTRAILKCPPGVLIIASGDRDFIPLVTIAKEEGWQVEMAAFNSAFQATGEMALAVDRIRPFDGSLDLIGHCA
jgi:uncharacterized LabA/DUF88 family protein